MLYTNQSEDLPEFAGNTGFTDEHTWPSYFGDTSQYRCDTNENVIPLSTALGNSCKTHSEAVSLKYTIEHTNIDPFKIIQAFGYLQNVGARFWDIPPLPPKCEIFPLLMPNVLLIVS